MTVVVITTPGGDAEAWLARPDAQDGDVPGILLFMDAIGLRPRLKEMADRMANWGYVVLAPNLFHRSGTADETSPVGDLLGPGAREAFFEQAVPRMKDFTSDLARADTTTYLEYLTGTPGVSNRVGAVGYCMGVRHALRAAGDHPDQVVAVGGFHGGGLVTDAEDSPHLWLDSTRASVFLRHADNDQSMTPQDMEVLAARAESAGVDLDQDFYADSVHGYSMADTPMYGPEAAQRHFSDLEHFFGGRLKR